MIRKTTAVKCLIKLGVSAFLALSAITTVQAGNSDPSGLWKWTTPGHNGATARVVNLRLQASGENLTGALLSPNRTNDSFNEVEIKDGKISGGTLSFTLSRPGLNGGPPAVTRYSGKFSADLIDGQTEGPGRNGETPSAVAWKAERNTTGKPVAGAKIVIKPGYDQNGNKIVNETHYKEISVAEAEQFLRDHPDAIILDLRPPALYAAGHLPKARNYDVTDEATYKAVLAPLDKSKWYLVHSVVGHFRTVRALEYFEANGFEHAAAIDGGYKAWVDADKPVVREDQQPAQSLSR